MAIALRFVRGMGNMNRWVETLDGRQQRLRQSMSTGYQIHDRRVLGRTVWAQGRVLESGGKKIPSQRTRVQVQPAAATVGQTDRCHQLIFKPPGTHPDTASRQVAPTIGSAGARDNGFTT